MPSTRNVASLLCSLALGFLCVGLSTCLACLGAFLNRGRGGFVHFGPPNASDPDYEVWYWPTHILSRLLFAVPTGLLVLLFGLHFRASFMVTVMTWFSLYVGWGCYMGIGMVDNVNSRSGIFDWVLGRQGGNWTMGHRFVREYAGMSLRGLIWTAPQGYVLERLGFGWEYSLSGSLMGLVYYVGANTEVNGIHDNQFLEFFNKGTAAAEVYWGWWMWFVLSMVSLAQLVRRGRIWVYKKNPYLGTQPFSTWENFKYLSLNRFVFRFCYECFMCTFNLLLCCSLVFYDLVEQTDLRNKTQTFFGLFTAILVLCFSQGWVWSLLFLNYKLKKLAKNAQDRIPEPDTLQSGGSNHSYSLDKQLSPSPTNSYHRRSPAHVNELERYEATAAIINGETQPLLSWPYSHPDRGSPTGERINTLMLPEGNPSVSRNVHRVMQPPSTSTAFMILWPSMENWIWLDIFVLVRRLIGLVSFLSTILTLVLTVIAVVWDFESPRFMHIPASIFIMNATAIPGL